MRTRSLAAAVGVALASFCLAEPTVGISTVIRTDDPIPDRPGLTFDGYMFTGGGQAINDAGSVALTAKVAPGSNVGAVLTGPPGGLSTVFVTGEQAPEFPVGVVQASATGNLLGAIRLILNEQGGLCWLGHLTGPGIVINGDQGNNSAIWRWTPGDGQTLIAQSQDQAPFLPGGTVFRLFETLDFSHNDSGVVMIGQDSLVPPFTAGPRGIWAFSPDGTTAGVVGADQAAQQAAGVDYGTIGVPGAVINNPGSVAFQTRLTGPGIGPSNDRALYAGPIDDLQLIAAEGQNAPGMGATFRDFDADGIMVADPDRLAFRAFLNPTGNASAIYTGTSDQYGLAVGANRQAPGMDPGVLFTSPSSNRFVLDDSGRFAIGARFTGPGVTTSNDSALFIGVPPNLIPIAREGNPVPGQPGLVYGNMQNVSIQLNNSGQAAFSAPVTGGVGLFFVTTQNQVVFILQSNTWILTDRGGFFAQILFENGSAWGLSEGGPSTGRARTLNDAGQLIFAARSGTANQGVFIATLDENAPCNAADLAEPLGLLDLADINAFVDGFTGMTTAGDLNGDGLWDLTDVNMFVAAFSAGCP